MLKIRDINERTVKSTGEVFISILFEQTVGTVLGMEFRKYGSKGLSVEAYEANKENLVVGAEIPQLTFASEPDEEGFYRVVPA